MTNAELIAKIRAEIESRKEAILSFPENEIVTFEAKSAVRSMSKELLSFLSDLEKSEKPMNQDELEKEIHKYNKERFDEYFPEQDGDFISEVDFMTCLGRVARHFAQWGAEHLKK